MYEKLKINTSVLIQDITQLKVFDLCRWHGYDIVTFICLQWTDSHIHQIRDSQQFIIQWRKIGRFRFDIPNPEIPAFMNAKLAQHHPSVIPSGYQSLVSKIAKLDSDNRHRVEKRWYLSDLGQIHANLLFLMLKRRQLWLLRLINLQSNLFILYRLDSSPFCARLFGFQLLEILTCLRSMKHH